MVIFGIVLSGASILMLVFIMIRVTTTVYIRDVDPYIRNRNTRPPTYESIKEEEEPIPFLEFANGYNQRRRAAIQTKHDEFLRTPLGQSYLRILNGTNK